MALWEIITFLWSYPQSLVPRNVYSVVILSLLPLQNSCSDLLIILCMFDVVFYFPLSS
uniref:Uncharacterized protein n=1 Tax=Arundo donax TaxID=35708 RepID=A0A0A9HRP6_ARUDO